MGNITLTRRALFTKLIKKLLVNAQEKDPLFEKYSRKIYTGRRYSSLTNPKRNLAAKLGQETERVTNVTSGLAAYTGTWGTSEALHLLKRTGFGFKKADVDTILNLGMNQAVNLILTVDNTPPAPPVNHYENENPDENGLPYGADWTNNAFAANDVGGDTNGNRTSGLSSWSLGLAFNQDITIREKMTLFWYHFIPVDFEFVKQSSNEYCNSNSARICYKYMKMFRDNATGNYKSLIRSMATQPAMMFYLNNQANTKTAPDENFAREVMELFTLGKDEDSQYTEADVIQAAKVLTGWRVQNLNTTTEATNFIDNLHDTSTKKFSSFFNNTVIPNIGAGELDLFIDMIFAKSKVVSEYICRRLYRFFVYYDIDANIEANVIVPLAQHFVANNWNILPVLDKLFKSEHFFDMANRGVYIKSPLDVIVGTMRTFNLNYNVEDIANYEAQYHLWNQFNYAMYDMQQSIGAIPNVAGWQAFYQKPSFHEYWINSNSIQRRYGLIDYLFYGFDIEKNGLTTRMEVDVIAYVKQFPNAVCEDPNLLVNECLQYLVPIDFSINAKNAIKTQTLLTGQDSDKYWSGAWRSYIANPNEMTLSIVRTRIRSLLLTIVEFAEYQLM
ncbi:DUF1800 domain-containing protein [Flavobacterium aquicola]|uniref:Uncharacterized protein DUF1800 n=1 Tax=Flavobacterium aquicola TaxID=1682742 RepID=A0A3E0DYI2_9FLAO|nr:DUF1800 family protein [Flavobacterium aquicola]REG91154.1 uncharacterized protein DUF1800 [Flavobacterium aquicola]